MFVDERSQGRLAAVPQGLRKHLRPAMLVHAIFPAIFLSYATVANLHFLIGAKQIEIPRKMTLSYVVEGNAAKDMESVYKDGLPYRDAAVGVVGALRYAVFRSGRHGVVVGSDNWLFTDEEFAPINQAAIDDAVTRIAAIRERLHSVGSELVMVPIPAKADLYGDRLPPAVDGSHMRNVYREFSTRLTESGIRTIDSRDALMKARQASPVFLRSDTHWTLAGSAAVAERIGSELKTADLDIPQHLIEMAAPKTVYFWGDLTRFVTSADFAPLAGLHEEEVDSRRAAVVETAAADLFGDSSTPAVVLVGTSYSANEKWSFADYLRVDLSTDVLNMAEEGLGPGVPMLKYLDSEAFRDSAPKLVIWEFPVRYLPSETLWQVKQDATASAEDTSAREDSDA
jgi:alginate O-acetyltransferase complex protein AlgJ